VHICGWHGAVYVVEHGRLVHIDPYAEQFVSPVELLILFFPKFTPIRIYKVNPDRVARPARRHKHIAIRPFDEDVVGTFGVGDLFEGESLAQHGVCAVVFYMGVGYDHDSSLSTIYVLYEAIHGVSSLELQLVELEIFAVFSVWDVEPPHIDWKILLLKFLLFLVHGIRMCIFPSAIMEAQGVPGRDNREACQLAQLLLDEFGRTVSENEHVNDPESR